MSASIRALIVDDNAGARRHLRELLRSHNDIHVVSECDGGRAAVGAVAAEAPDLVFLDVEMPDLDGFGVIAEVGGARMPAVIFTSAYSEYAVRAFEAYALDYLLKPFDGARLSAAVRRARETLAPRGEADARLAGLLEFLERQHPGDRQPHPDAVAVKTGDRYQVIPLAAVDWIEADGSYARLWVAKRPRLITKTLATLEKDVLDPEVFVRVHKSAIVNTRKVASVEPNTHGDAKLLLHDGSSVTCSRRYRERLQRKIYLST